MLTIRDLAEILVQKHQLDTRSAEIFMNAVVDTIHEGLKNDRVVKVKGFGTFKLTAVRERESINVNTGERVVISSHDKVSFTPDAVMRDLVNKPFAQFDTVVLADGVDFEDMPEIDVEDGETIAEEPVVEQVGTSITPAVEETSAAPAVEETPVTPVVEEAPVTPAVGEAPVTPAVEVKSESVIVPMNESVVAPVSDENSVQPILESEETSALMSGPELDSVKKPDSELVDEPELESVNEPEPEPETNPGSESEIEDEIPSYYDDEDDDMGQCKKIFLMYAIIVNVIVAALFFVFGYYAHSSNLLGIEKETTPSVETPAQPVVETPAVKPAETPTPAKTESKAEEQKEETRRPQETAAKKEPTAEVKKSGTEQKAEAKTETSSRYDSDPRVRTGAYRIVGTSSTVTVKSGQSIKSISKTYLGAGMECYIEAYNGGITEVKDGQTIKIPKLELKKKAKKSGK